MVLAVGAVVALDTIHTIGANVAVITVLTLGAVRTFNTVNICRRSTHPPQPLPTVLECVRSRIVQSHNSKKSTKPGRPHHAAGGLLSTQPVLPLSPAQFLQSVQYQQSRQFLQSVQL